MDIMTYINLLRKDKGISQRELARRAQVSHTEISRIEKGERLRPSPAVLSKLASVLGVKSELLMEAAGYIKVNPRDAGYLVEGQQGELETDYQLAVQRYELPILCKEGGTISGYLDMQCCKDFDFALRVVDNHLACASIYRGDLALCSNNTEIKDARVLVVESANQERRELILSLNNCVELSIESAIDAGKLVTDGEWRVIGRVAAVMRSMEWESAYNDDMIKWQELGLTAKKMGFNPDQVSWMMQTQSQFLKKFAKNK